MAEGSLSAAPAIRLGRKDLNNNRKDNFDFLVLFFDGGLNLSDLSTTISIIIQSFILYQIKEYCIVYTVFYYFETANLFFVNYNPIFYLLLNI
jgi:hypothetical protein